MASLIDSGCTVNELSALPKGRRELQLAINCLNSHGRVVIVGSPKSGKTFLGHALLDYFRSRFASQIVCTSRSLRKRKHLEEARPRILLMDGTLGEVRVDMQEYKVWRAVLPRLMALTDMRQCLLVVTLYPHVLLELRALEAGSQSPLVEDSCKVSLKDMDEDEKKAVLYDFLSDVDMMQQEKHEVVDVVLKNDISGASFPWCCAQLVQRLHNASVDNPSVCFTAPAESYVPLLHRMLMDPTHGEILVALMCLTMMGLSDFFHNQEKTRTALRALGFRNISTDWLEKNASFLNNFILSEDYSTFCSRIVYDAVGLALGCSHRLPVLLEICDMEFLVKYVRVWGKQTDRQTVIILNSLNRKHLMERIMIDIEKCQSIDVSQCLSLQSEIFLEKLEEYSRTRTGGVRPILQAVDTEHGLPLLYWSVGTGCDWLINWCLDLSTKHGVVPPGSMQFAFVLALVHRTQCIKTNISLYCKIFQAVLPDLHSEYNSTDTSVSLPRPCKVLDFAQHLTTVYNKMTSCANFSYLCDPSLPLPKSALIVNITDTAIHVKIPNKKRHLALRLLYDTQVDEVDSQENTLLHLAAEASDQDVIDVAVKSGASLTARNNMGLTPPQVAQARTTGENVIRCSREGKEIHKACEDGDILTVKVLLCCGVSVEMRGSDNRTPLHTACQAGHTDIVRLLLDLGADVNVVITEGATLCHVVCNAGLKGSNQCVPPLLKRGVYAKFQSTNGWTPLHCASSKAKTDTVALLLDRGSNVNAQSTDGETPLHCASSEGKTDTVALLLDRGSDVNAKTISCETPLHCASSGSRTDTVALLLDGGSDVNAKTKSGEIPLHYASCGDRSDTVALLLDRGSDVYAKTDYGETPLHFASLEGKTDTVALLLDRGANVNSESHTSHTPLHYASFVGKTDTIALLLDRGSNVYAKTDEGVTPLHFASFRGKTDTVALLLDRGCDVNAKTKTGKTPLHYASFKGKTDTVALLLDRGSDVYAKADDGETPLHYATLKGKTDTVALLLDRGSDINCKRDDGETPLHYASSVGKTDTIALLLDRGSDVNAETDDGETPLHCAFFEGRTDTVALLLNRGFHVNAKAKSGETQLHQASFRGKTDTVALLLDRGSDVNAKTDDGETPLHYASLKGKTDTVALLLDRGSDTNCKRDDGETPLHQASFIGKTDTVALLLDRGSDVNAKTDDGETPLHYASLKGKTDTVALLLDRGSDINCKRDEGETPLHQASFIGKTDTVALLLDRGSDVNAKTDDGETPLHYASSRGKTDTVALLLNRGSDVNAKTKSGETPLHQASFRGKTDTVALLLGRGCNVNAKTKRGKTPLHCASSEGKTDTVALLLDRGADTKAKNIKGETPVDFAERKSHIGTLAVLYSVCV